VDQLSGTILVTPRVLSERAWCLHGQMTIYLICLKPLPHKARIDYRACLHAIWSGPEGSSHSGNIECRGVAGGAASISGGEKPQFAANAFVLPCFIPNAPVADSFISR
jgi:hypothetical protein